MPGVEPTLAGTVNPERLITAPSGGAEAVTVPPLHPAPTITGLPLLTNVLPVAGLGVRLEKFTPVNGVAESLVKVISTVVVSPGATDVGDPSLLFTPTVKSAFGAAQATPPALNKATATPAWASQRRTLPCAEEARVRTVMECWPKELSCGTGANAGSPTRIGATASTCCAGRSTSAIPSPEARRLLHETMCFLPTTDANRPAGTLAAAMVGRLLGGKQGVFAKTGLHR